MAPAIGVILGIAIFVSIGIILFRVELFGTPKMRALLKSIKDNTQTLQVSGRTATFTSKTGKTIVVNFFNRISGIYIVVANGKTVQIDFGEGDWLENQLKKAWPELKFMRKKDKQVELMTVDNGYGI
jgi:hypothetical protein